MTKYTKEEKQATVDWLDSIDVTRLAKVMEEMAGKPEERHTRQPGERGMYERT